MLKINKKIVLIMSMFMLISTSLLGLIPMNGNNIDMKNSKNALLSDGESDGDIRIEDPIDVPTGIRYTLWENYGGIWVDAEKVPPSDGRNNTNPGDPTTDDDELCWAATASNMLEWTGWGFIGGMEDNDTDEFFDYFNDHVNDFPHRAPLGLQWWFNGDLGVSPGDDLQEEVDHTGFWTGYTPSTYIDSFEPDNQCLPNIKAALEDEKAVGLSIAPRFRAGGHAVTCWGFNYNATLDPVADIEDYYLGVWLSDSDSHRTLPEPHPDVLRYFEVDYNSTSGHWWMPSYSDGWYIRRVDTLEVFPGEQRPIASIANIVGTEGTAITFDASGSVDPDGDSLEYRWDFDADGVWDTLWSSSATATYIWDDDYTGEVIVEVFDGRLRDIDTAMVNINNVAPTITVNSVVINENDFAALTGTISDPSSLDSFIIIINWGDGNSINYAVPAGSTTFTYYHQYIDDNPSGTSSDIYTVSITIMDDDFGNSVTNSAVTVDNVAPIVSIDSVSQFQNFVLEELTVAMLEPVDFTATAIDIGTDDLTFIWNWGDNTPDTIVSFPYGGSIPVIISDISTHIFAEPGEYTVVLTIEDDDLGFVQTSIVITVIGPQQLKQMAIDTIEDLKTGHWCKDFKYNSLIFKIERSLCDRLWEDEIRLDQRFGSSVFCWEMKAVMKIEREFFHNHWMISVLENKITFFESKGYNTDYLEEYLAELLGINEAYESVMQMLVKADEILARVALNDAINTPVINPDFQDIVDWKIGIAQKNLDLAMEFVDERAYSKAICHFKISWQFSQFAIQWANKEYNHCYPWHYHQYSSR